jgi:hypothetical protein
MRYNKKQIEQKRLRRLNRELGSYYYPSGVYFKDGRYVRVQGKPNGMLTFMKKHNNKRLRHFDGILSDGSHYRKVNPHWWVIL